jgi:hypothetical protein
MSRNRITEKLIRVEGRNPFPIDMLRYDCAIPASEIDSNKIAASHNWTGLNGPMQIEVRVKKESGPTQGRWESFGWRIVAVYDGYDWCNLVSSGGGA